MLTRTLQFKHLELTIPFLFAEEGSFAASLLRIMPTLQFVPTVCNVHVSAQTRSKTHLQSFFTWNHLSTIQGSQFFLQEGFQLFQKLWLMDSLWHELICLFCSTWVEIWGTRTKGMCWPCIQGSRPCVDVRLQQTGVKEKLMRNFTILTNYIEIHCIKYGTLICLMIIVQLWIKISVYLGAEKYYSYSTNLQPCKRPHTLPTGRQA